MDKSIHIELRHFFHLPHLPALQAFILHGDVGENVRHEIRTST